MLPFFQDLSNYVVRIYDVVKNIVHQLASLYTERRVIQFDPTGIHLQPIYEHLGDALAILVILDEMINSNEHLLDHWKQYKMFAQQPEILEGPFSQTSLYLLG